MKTRIYLVTDGTEKRLVRAQSQAQAVRHCVKHYSAETPTAEQLVSLVSAGTKVEDAQGEAHE